jgi:hypothetical protein
MKTRPTLLLLVLASLPGCLGGPRPEGLAPARQTGGPRVDYDTTATPLPEIPLPNDAATRPDPTAVTGRRLNVSVEAAKTDHEREVRERFNRMDGFGTFLPISVSFDKPLDVPALLARHDDDDFRDDAVFLLNVDPDCDRFGEEIALDIGRGVFPVTSYDHGSRRDDPLAPGGYRLDWDGNVLFPFDAEGLTNQRMFAERDEDADDDGFLDEGEDADFDGVLDVPNLSDPHACDALTPDTVAYDRCIADHLVPFYERETDTLILKPIWPMEQRCTHAVVLSDRLVGLDGASVVSPFAAVNHSDQTNDLRPVGSLLARYGLTEDNIAFAWTFTTGSMTADMEALRAGLYGSGVYSFLEAAFPVSSLHLWTRAEMAGSFGNITPVAGKEQDTYFAGACMGAAFAQFWNEGQGEWDANMCAVEADLSAASMFFGGTFPAPDLLADSEGLATPRYPHSQNEVWKLDPAKGELHYGSTDVTFWCSLPYEDPDAACEPGNPDGVPGCAPFPVVLYAHGYGGSRAEISLHMGRHNAMGVAACALDAYGHGLNVYRQDPLAAAAVASQAGKFAALGVPELPGLLTIGRDRDLDNDGIADPGMDQWTSDIFHTRDMVRQSALEVTQFVRILRHMDGTTRDASGRLLGDVDGDGDVDLGGPTNTLGYWGISLGGIIAGVSAGAEPSLDAVSPNAGGAGLTEISIRSSQAGVPEAVLLPMLGQLVVGCLPTDGHDNPLPVGTEGGTDCWQGRGADDATWRGGTLRLAMYNSTRASFELLEVGAVEGVEVGDRVCLTNLRNGDEDCALVNERGWFRLGVAADALDAIERRTAMGLPDDVVGDLLIEEATRYADPIALTVGVGQSEAVRARVDTFQREVRFQGGIYAAGSTWVALQNGYGHKRNSPDFRRLLGFAQAALGPGDPVEWGVHSFVDPLDVSAYDPFTQGGNTRVLLMPTVGDPQVPVSTGIHMGRVSGLFGSWLRDEANHGPEVGWRAYFEPNPKWGMTVDAWMRQNFVMEADWRLQRFDQPDYINPNVLYDPDNVSDGATRFSCGPTDWSALNGEHRCPDALLGEFDGEEVFFDVPNPAPGQEMRLDHAREDGSFDAFRVPLLRPAGQHGIYNAQSFRTFDNDAFMVNFTSRFLVSGGRDTSHAPGCDCSASSVGNFTLNDAPYFAGLGRQCTPDDLKVCDATCATAWGIRTPVEAACALP